MSNKIKRLENKRKSILTDNLNYCIMCGLPKQHLHEVFEGSNRIASMKNNMVIPLCFSCHQNIHNNRELALYYKRMCQSKFEEEHSREEFIDIFKRNYI